jgi:hypothetical protein
MAALPYNDTPQATNPINQTQAPIRTNFQSIRALIDVNMVDFADPVNAGKFNLVALVNQVASPPMGGFNATDVGFYNFVMPVASGTNLNEVYINKSSLSGTNPFPVVTQQVPATSYYFDVTALFQGWTILASGLIIKFGRTGALAPGTNTPIAITSGTQASGPVMTQVLTLVVTPVSSPGAIDAQGVPNGTNGIIINTTSGCPGGCTWWLIGTLV